MKLAICLFGYSSKIEITMRLLTDKLRCATFVAKGNIKERAMANPLRLSSELVEAAERESRIQKRSVPKQIEFWAALGKAVQNVIDYSDAIAITQGLKKIIIEPVKAPAASPADVFARLERNRDNGSLAGNVTTAAIYYETSKSHPGMIDRVDSTTGERRTGRFRNGQFRAIE